MCRVTHGPYLGIEALGAGLEVPPLRSQTPAVRTALKTFCCLPFFPPRYIAFPVSCMLRVTESWNTLALMSLFTGNSP